MYVWTDGFALAALTDGQLDTDISPDIYLSGQHDRMRSLWRRIGFRVRVAGSYRDRGDQRTYQVASSTSQARDAARLCLT